MDRPIHRHRWTWIGPAAWLLASALAPAVMANPPTVELYRLKMPGGQDVFQASDLCSGRVGEHEGLWIVCDRHGGPCGNRILFIDRQTLTKLKNGGDASVTQSFPAAGPTEGWEPFNKRHDRIAPEILNELRRQFENVDDDGPLLDFEGIAIGPRSSILPTTARGQPSIPADTSPSNTPSDPALFVITEQPHSIVLEFVLVEDHREGRAELRDCFLYEEKAEDMGGDANDGLEGIAWAGEPGMFFICEEGTRPYRPGDNLHFFDEPRLMRTRLVDGQCAIEEPWSTRATESVRSQRDKPSQTLNALTMADDRTLLGVDRNGGWILATDVTTGQTRRWLSLYDPKGLNLRTKLADFPAPRHMPYVSIEGLARDDHGNLWLVDDPAMPEGFRESCLIQVKNLPPLPPP